MKSPCRECDRHKKEFPDCLEGCQAIAEFQSMFQCDCAPRSLERESFTEFTECPINVVSPDPSKTNFSRSLFIEY